MFLNNKAPGVFVKNEEKSFTLQIDNHKFNYTDKYSAKFDSSLQIFTLPWTGLYFHARARRILNSLAHYFASIHPSSAHTDAQAVSSALARKDN